jgi:hypothetical protein
MENIIHGLPDSPQVIKITPLAEGPFKRASVKSVKSNAKTPKVPTSVASLPEVGTTANIVMGIEPDEQPKVEPECGFAYECLQKVNTGGFRPQFCQFGRSLDQCPDVINLREQRTPYVGTSQPPPYTRKTQRDRWRGGSYSALS